MLCIDVETGGTDSHEHSLLEIGAVKFHPDWDNWETYQALVREDEIVNEAEDIHGISTEQVLGEGIPPEEAHDSLCKFLASNMRDPLIGFNPAFDRAFLERLWRHAGATDFDEWFHYRVIDMDSILMFLGEAGVMPEFAGLSRSIEYFLPEKEDIQRHRALDDALASAEIYIELLSGWQETKGHLFLPGGAA